MISNIYSLIKQILIIKFELTLNTKTLNKNYQSNILLKLLWNSKNNKTIEYIF